MKKNNTNHVFYLRGLRAFFCLPLKGAVGLVGTEITFPPVVVPVDPPAVQHSHQSSYPDKFQESVVHLIQNSPSVKGI